VPTNHESTPDTTHISGDTLLVVLEATDDIPAD